MACPACGGGRFGHHGSYEKHHYRRRLTVVRVRCWGCRRTHALLPAFSLPGTSVGTRESEQYLLAREAGASRWQAVGELVRLGMSVAIGKQLERRLTVAVTRAKALWPHAGDQLLSGLAWIRSACAANDTPLLQLNRFCLERQVNPVCFCRSSILLFGRSRAAPHDLGSASSSVAGVPSASR